VPPDGRRAWRTAATLGTPAQRLAAADQCRAPASPWPAVSGFTRCDKRTPVARRLMCGCPRVIDVDRLLTSLMLARGGTGSRRSRFTRRGSRPSSRCWFAKYRLYPQRVRGTDAVRSATRCFKLLVRAPNRHRSESSRTRPGPPNDDGLIHELAARGTHRPPPAPPRAPASPSERSTSRPRTWPARPLLALGRFRTCLERVEDRARPGTVGLSPRGAVPRTSRKAAIWALDLPLVKRDGT